MALVMACAVAVGCEPTPTPTPTSPWKYVAKGPLKSDPQTGPCLGVTASDTPAPKPAPSPVLPLATRTFVQGVAGYEGTTDLHLSIPAAFYHPSHPRSHFDSDPGNPRMEWNLEDTYGVGSLRLTSHAFQHGAGDNVALLRFDKIFGSGAGQVPAGARIIKATLHLNAAVPGDLAAVHRVLIPWSNSARWSTFGPQPGPNFGVDLAPEVAARTGVYQKQLEVDVTASLERWSTDPGANQGWAFMPVASHSIIRVQGSAIDTIKSVRVHLNIKAARRGEVVATLRHGGYTALLLNRSGRIPCDGYTGATGKDFDVVIDQAADLDIHLADSKVSPLKGAFKPDGACGKAPLCGDGDEGFCGQPADGEWILQVNDEWVTAGEPVTVVDWSIELDDGVHPVERWHYGAGVPVPNRNLGNVYGTKVWTSEAPEAADRPRLTVQFSPALAFEPETLLALPKAGLVVARLRLPPEADASRPVQVKLLSDNPLSVQALDCTTTFAVDGPSVVEVPLWIGAAGSARVRAISTAGVAEGILPVTVGPSPMTARPDTVYRGVAAQSAALQINLPAGATASGLVTIQVTSDNPKVAQVAEGSTLVFGPGKATTQTVTLKLGSGTGKATVTLTDSGGKLASLQVPVVLSLQPPATYEVLVPPYLQLGDGDVGAKTDALAIVWQTITLEEGGPHADHFVFAWRVAGSPKWQVAPIQAPTQVGSATRLRHVARLKGLPTDGQFEYRLVQMRDGKALPNVDWQAPFQSRATGPFRFTAYGNSGTGNTGAQQVADLLLDLKPDLHVLLGDFVYDKGEMEHYPARLFAYHAPFSQSRVLTYTPGNHDVIEDKGQPIFANLLAPTNGPPGIPDGLHFAFDYGNARFFSVYTGDQGGKLAPVIPWLKTGLAASNQTWNIVLTHELPLQKDPFSIDRVASEAVRKLLLKTAVQGNANLFVGGAAHSWQRYLPITKVPAPIGSAESAPCAQGNGTTIVYPGTGSWARDPLKPLPSKFATPLVSYLPERGVGVFDIKGDKMTIRFVNVSGKVADEVVISNCAKGDCECP